MTNALANYLDDLPMGKAQYIAITICIVLAAFDGFDILVIAFAAPGIASEWGLSEGYLGWVMTMELIGMAIGAALMGNLADVIGRRPIILMSIFIITAGMLAAAIAPNVEFLSVARILTGMGIGAVLASCNALVAELCNQKNRSTFILLMTAGYAVGSIVGGLISAEMLKYYDWRSLFLMGAVGTAVVYPFAHIYLYESVSYLAKKQPENALAKMNNVLQKLGHETVSSLPEKVTEASTAGVKLLFGSKYLKITALLSLSFLAHVSTYYFILKWIPKLVVDMGFTESQGGSVLVWATIGNLAGTLALAYTARKFDLRRMIILIMCFAVLFVCVFGQVSANMMVLSIAAVATAFFNSAAAAGMYPLIAEYFPTEVRAGGTGIVVAIGRGGAVAGPVIAGYLLQAGIPLTQVTMILSLGTVIAAISLWALGPKSAESQDA